MLGLVLADIFIALVHHPVYNKNREVIASALTTIDLHDLARLAATYGLAGFYLVTPLTDQVRLAEDMIGHWKEGPGAAYNRDRAQAIESVRVSGSLETALADAARRSGTVPLLVGTSARDDGPRVTFPEMRTMLKDPRPVMILFGTAWGLTDEVQAGCDLFLESIKGMTQYNHLSVRSAAGIILDRLLGRDADGGAI